MWKIHYIRNYSICIILYSLRKNQKSYRMFCALFYSHDFIKYSYFLKYIDSSKRVPVAVLNIFFFALSKAEYLLPIYTKMNIAIVSCTFTFTLQIYVQKIKYCIFCLFSPNRLTKSKYCAKIFTLIF